MHPLDAKLLRDLSRMRAQVLAIALVVASGVALLVMSLSALSSLRATAEAYYDRYRFAEVFAGVKRAPERLAERIAEIPGVQTVETRVAAFATVEMPGLAEPVTAQLLSLPEGRRARLNRLALVEGRRPEPGRDDEAVLHAPFAQANGLGPGDSVTVLLRGVKRELRVVGLALSPEFIYAIAPGGLMPDDRRFGVIWMGRDALAAAYDLEGAFNDLSLGLLRGADPRIVIERLEPMIAPHGGQGAVAREDQLSHFFLESEFDQLRTMATILPGIFLSVAVFLTNTVLARLIATERREISLLKAFGYANRQVALHYVKLALAIATVGILLGWALGAALGRWNTANYSEFFHFPFLYYRPSGAEFALSAAIGLASALVGALWAVRDAVRLPPAAAMRPPAPTDFRSASLPRALARRLDSPTRIVLRQILRAPVRSGLTVAGVALSVGLLVMALQWWASITHLVHSHYVRTEHQDMTLAFHEPRDIAARHALARLPGVLTAEPMRYVSADLRHGHRVHRGTVTGVRPGATLESIHDVRGWTLPVPRGGVVIDRTLAGKLGVSAGDLITAEIREGARPVLRLTVAAVYETYIGSPAYMEIGALTRAIGEPGSFDTARLLVDDAAETALYEAVSEIPGVASLMVKERAVRQFHETLGEVIFIFVGFFVAFACALAYGVLYNATRIALSERARELATLRVLGFTRWEISYILLGEAALLVILALPLGCLAGAGLIVVMAQAFETELYRVPLVMPAEAFGWAMAIILAAGAVSAALVRRRLDRLDLVAVLKTRE